ncbi:GerW family sporulation protein [Paenibacillus marinisediminis]
MADHPIEGLMRAALENIKAMVDVNAIVGDPVQTPDGSVILPISRVGIGFAAGGSEFKVFERRQQADRDRAHQPSDKPFGGGAGGGVFLVPIAFLIVGKQGVQVVSVDNNTHLLEKLIDSAPQVMDRFESMFRQTPKVGKTSDKPNAES